MSLMAGSRHYLRDSVGEEELYDVESDPRESRDLKNSPDGLAALNGFRLSILQIVTADPATIGTAALSMRQFTTALESLVGRPPVPNGPGTVEVRPPLRPGGM